MAAHDRIRLTGLLRKRPRAIGAFSMRASDRRHRICCGACCMSRWLSGCSSGASFSWSPSMAARAGPARGSTPRAFSPTACASPASRSCWPSGSPCRSPWRSPTATTRPARARRDYTLTKNQAVGRELFARSCATCHTLRAAAAVRARRPQPRPRPAGGRRPGVVRAQRDPHGTRPRPRQHAGRHLHRPAGQGRRGLRRGRRRAPVDARAPPRRLILFTTGAQLLRCADVGAKERCFELPARTQGELRRLSNL